MTRPALALLVSLALTAPALAAQSPRVPVPVGARVRVAAPPRIGWTTGAVAVPVVPAPDMRVHEDPHNAVRAHAGLLQRQAPRAAALDGHAHVMRQRGRVRRRQRTSRHT